MVRSSYSLSIGKKKKRYGFWKFVLDITLTVLTGGLWLLWIIFRFLRSV